MRKKFILLILLIILFILIGVTYSWFYAVIQGNETAKIITVKAGKLEITYIDGPELNVPNIIPGWTASKTFTIENTGDESATYKIAWKNLQNDFINRADLLYNLTSTNGGGSLGQTQIPDSENHILIADNITIASGVTQTYTMTMQYLLTQYNQGSDKERTLTGVIEVLDLQDRTIAGQTTTGSVTPETEGDTIYGKTMVDLLNALYPVGSVYTSTTSTNPGNIMGGEWTRIHDTFLLAAGDTYPADDGTHTTFTAGSPDAVVVTHTHTTAANAYKNPGSNASWSAEEVGAISGTGQKLAQIPSGNTFTYTTHTHNVLAPTNGVFGTGKNMPPYLTVYMWKRIN